MPIDDRTTNRSYKLPNAGNFLADDVQRLRDALTAIDADVFARYTKTETNQKLADLINGAPGALDTLNELAAAMGNDPNFAATITNALAGKPGFADVWTRTQADARYVQGVTQTENTFTGTGSQTTFALSQTPPTRESLLVTVDGVVQPVSAYTLSGSALILSEAPASGASIRVLMLGVAGPVQSASTLNFSQAGTGAVTRTVESKLREAVSVKDFGAVGNGVADDTAAIQAAINSATASGSGAVFLPRGQYLINPAVGINVTDGLTLLGEGRGNSQLIAKPVGGTIIKRAFNPTGPNAYVTSVTIRDIGIILRHPATADPSNYYQVAIQLRHITRSLVEDVYIGNYPAGISSGLSSPGAQADARQGYGVSIGSSAAGDPAYAGGEVNTCRRVFCTGVRKGFVLDDPTFDTPYGGSAAYTTVIDCCEVSGAEVGIAQYGQYGAGCTFSNNVIQAIDQMRGSSATAYSIYIDGYEHLIYGGYNESPFTDYELFLSSTSRRNRVLTWLSDEGAFSDNGIGNVYERINGTTNKWELSVNKRNYGRAFVKAWVNFYWDGSAVVIKDSYGISSILRIGAGDYRIDFSAGVVADANYTLALTGETNASAHVGIMYLRGSKSTANCRIQTYNLNTASYIDFLDNTVTVFGNQ